MKKQLLIAAVAATMTSVAMADISITGSTKINYTNTDSATESLDTNAFSSEINLGVVGTSGDTTVNVNLQTKNTGDQSSAFVADTSNGFDIQDAYVTTSVGDFTIKTGSIRGAHNLLEDGDATSANKFKVSTSVAGVGISYEHNAGGQEKIGLSGEVSGVALAHKMYNDGAGVDTTDTSVSTTLQGVSIAYRAINTDGANNDIDSLEVSGDAAGVTFTYASIDSEGTGTTITSDGFLGDIESMEADGFGIKTVVAGNTVQIKSISHRASAGAVDTDLTKFVVTRALASGATFEAIYTDTDAAAGSTSDTKVLDLELAVKF
jgi:hypothetical protein